MTERANYSGISHRTLVAHARKHAQIYTINHGSLLYIIPIGLANHLPII